MASPLTIDVNVGYVQAEDVYVAFSEYYGDGTIYGRRDLLLPDGSPVKGAGRTKTELVASGVLVAEDATTVPGDLVGVPVDAPVADAPVADAPVADAPVADAPITDAPVADAPVPVPDTHVVVVKPESVDPSETYQIVVKREGFSAIYVGKGSFQVTVTVDDVEKSVQFETV